MGSLRIQCDWCNGVINGIFEDSMWFILWCYQWDFWGFNVIDIMVLSMGFLRVQCDLYHGVINGIFEDSMWFNGGMNGIYEDSMCFFMVVWTRFMRIQCDLVVVWTGFMRIQCDLMVVWTGFMRILWVLINGDVNGIWSWKDQTSRKNKTTASHSNGGLQTSTSHFCGNLWIWCPQTTKRAHQLWPSHYRLAHGSLSRGILWE